MGRKTFMTKMSAEMVEQLNAKIDAEGETIDELVDWLEKVTESTVSRSSVGRIVQKRRARNRAIGVIADTAAMPDSGSDEAVDLMMELATVRIKEYKILERLRELGAI